MQTEITERRIPVGECTLTGVGHWIPIGAPDRLNALLLDFLADPARR
ncbi:MAG TPA: hypothetical protein VLL08_21395 [Kineosporiaceae bacterium]|nr:hypothetical protein [Kineosporiaceae bacterium]